MINAKDVDRMFYSTVDFIIGKPTTDVLKSIRFVDKDAYRDRKKKCRIRGTEHWERKHRYTIVADDNVTVYHQFIYQGSDGYRAIILAE